MPKAQPALTDVTPRRVVIVGAGFGGLSAAKALAGSEFDVTVDRPPQLPSVPAAALSGGDRRAFAGRYRLPDPRHLCAARNINVVLAEVSASTRSRSEVIAEGRRIPFDYLIVATGAQHAYFGHDDWASYAPGLKTHRRRHLSPPPHPARLREGRDRDRPARARRLLNFVVVGGGPTGVEMAGAIAELAKRALAADFRSIDPR